MVQFEVGWDAAGSGELCFLMMSPLSVRHRAAQTPVWVPCCAPGDALLLSLWELGISLCVALQKLLLLSVGLLPFFWEMAFCQDIGLLQEGFLVHKIIILLRS